MLCSKCGQPAGDSAYCPHCGAPLSATASSGDQPVTQSSSLTADHSRASGAYAFKLEVARWSRADMVVGVATLILFISLFLPWYTIAFFSVDGLWRSYEYITLIVSILIIGYLIFRAGFGQLPSDVRVSHDVLLIIATAINLLVVVIGFADKPVSNNGVFSVTISWGAGAYLALITAIVAAAAAITARLPHAVRLCKAAIMRYCCAQKMLLRMTGGAFATVLAVSACGGPSGTNAGRSPVPHLTVTASANSSPTAASPSPTAAAASSPSPSASGTAATTGTWYYLADFNPVQTYGINVDSTAHTVNGITYDHPVAWSAGFSTQDPYWAEWDLSRQCTQLKSPGVGIADDAPSGASALFTVQTDGAYKWQKTISLGHSKNLNISIKDTLRLRLSAGSIQNGSAVGGSYATWGDAQVLCSSEPPNSSSTNN